MSNNPEEMIELMFKELSPETIFVTCENQEGTNEIEEEERCDGE